MYGNSEIYNLCCKNDTSPVVFWSADCRKGQKACPHDLSTYNSLQLFNMAERILNRLVEGVISLNECSSEASNALGLHAAIQASLEDQRETDSCSMNEAKASDVLREFVDDNLDNQSESRVNAVISGKNVLSSALRALERGKFSFVRPVHIMFSGEDGEDSGGPRREFFCLLMMSLKNLSIFYGTWFSYDLELLHGNKYELAGKLVAWSVLQGGPGSKPFLS